MKFLRQHFSWIGLSCFRTHKKCKIDFLLTNCTVLLTILLKEYYKNIDLNTQMNKKVIFSHRLSFVKKPVDVCYSKTVLLFIHLLKKNRNNWSIESTNHSLRLHLTYASTDLKNLFKSANSKSQAFEPIPTKALKLLFGKRLLRLRTNAQKLERKSITPEWSGLVLIPSTINKAF